jgi:maltose/moltooligosaccharide transporter
VSRETGAEHPIPSTVIWAFSIGAGVFICSVLWTIISTKEYPPEDLEALRRKKAEGFGEIFTAFKEMPFRMKQLAVVQFFTWMALFCMWIFFTVAVARNILGATDTTSDLYKQGIQLSSDCFAIYNLVAFFAAMGFLWLGRVVNARTIHVVSLLLGGIGLASVGAVHSPMMLKLAFVGVGIAWASILSMPYAMLSSALPADRMGVYMGIFNFFIVIPQILVAIIISRVMENFPQVNRLSAVVFGGCSMILAAVVTLFVRTDDSDGERRQRAAEGEGMLPSATPPESPL